MVYLGWLHFNTKRNTYVSLRENSKSGACKINIVNKEKILDEAKSRLFVDENGANSGAVL